MPDLDNFSSSSSNFDYSVDSENERLSATKNLDEVDKKLGELEIKMDSVNNKKEINIFKVISRRYFRSAYPVFFKKK